MESSRMQSILNAPRTDALIENTPSDIGFAFEDDTDAAATSVQPTVLVSNPSSKNEAELPSRTRGSDRIFGMTWSQIAILLGIFLIWVCVLVVGGGLLIYFGSK
jgi:hypothetical protein